MKRSKKYRAVELGPPPAKMRQSHKQRETPKFVEQAYEKSSRKTRS